MKLLMFTMDTCQPCKQLKPAVEAVCASKGIPLELVDAVEDRRGILYGIRSVPTLILLKDDEEVGRKIGSLSNGALERFLSGPKAK